MGKKQAGLPPPWSKDPTFQTTYFCNVCREDDRVTQWMRQRWAAALVKGGRPPNSKNTAFNMVLARVVNKPESLDALGWPWFGVPGALAWRKWHDVMSQPGAWGSAYIVSTNGRRMPKHVYIQGLLVAAYSPLQGMAFVGTLAHAHGQLMGLNGLGSFMAGQVVADLKNTRGHPLQEASDWRTWCAHGPGSLRGMAWVLGKERVTPGMFYENMLWLRRRVDDNVSTAVPALCAQDLQNCLCEFDKYMRVSTGAGRSKRKYNGR